MSAEDDRSDEALYVCPQCFGDEVLKSVIEAAAESPSCSFCGAQNRQPIAASLEEVAEYIHSLIRTEYDDPANWLAWEGEYIGETWDTEELLGDVIGIELPRDDGRLLEALAKAIDNLVDTDGIRQSPEIWCRKDPYGLGEFDALRESWDSFSAFVKYQRRYFFRKRDQPEPDHGLPSEILSPDDFLTNIAKRALDPDFDLVAELPPGTRVYRARFRPEGVRFTTPTDLGPPPQSKAKQNRMSPAGIAMFYGSEDVLTAIEEVYEKAGDYAVGEFALLRSVRILDLHQLPPVPSFFDETLGHGRDWLRFLRSFARDISKPIERDDLVHIEYVPTQVVTEYFRTQVRYGDQPIDGIAYDSSRNHGHRSYVLFATQEDLRLPDSVQDLEPDARERQEKAWLRLVAVSVHRRGESGH